MSSPKQDDVKPPLAAVTSARSEHVDASPPLLHPPPDPVSADGAQQGAQHGALSPADVQDMNILVMEDQKCDSLVIPRILSEAGFRQIHTITYSDAVGFQLRQLAPAAIVMDIGSCDAEASFLSYLRQTRHLKNVATLVLTDVSDRAYAAELLDAGADDVLCKPVHPGELAARLRSLLRAHHQCEQLQKYSSRLEMDVLQDPLTGLANRRAFDFELNRRVIEWQRRSAPFSLLLIDIDQFKQINDQWGHPTGDDVLRLVAKRIKNNMRAVDLSVRLGGDEFAAILPGSLPSEACRAAERLRQTLAVKPFQFANRCLTITASLGVTVAIAGDDAAALLRRADEALYASKSQGRNRSSYHDGSASHPVDPEVTESQWKLVECNSREMPPQSLQQTDVRKSKIIVVDDEPSTSLMVRKLLRNDGYENVITEQDSRRAFALIEAELPDLILLDIRMPYINGLEVIKAIRSHSETQHIPVVFLTSETDEATKLEALRLQANDFLNKPVNASELVTRVRNTLLAKAHLDYVSNYSRLLENEVNRRTIQLVASQREAISSLARASEMRDDITGFHVIRVGKYTAVIADQLGFSHEYVEWIEMAAQLHDVGKIGIPDSILKKPAKLTAEEYNLMKSHAINGSRILARRGDRRDPAGGTPPQAVSEGDTEELGSLTVEMGEVSPLMQMAALIAETHHEKWDGTGYPRGLSGEDIPIEGRIVAVADVFDALASRRPYKQAFDVEECFQIIQRDSGRHFDPDVVTAFMARKDDILAICKSWSD